MGKNTWLKQSSEEKYTVWAGYAFENVCIKHVEAIKMALGISGIYTETSSYLHKGNEESDGFQLDMLIDRADRAINLCEIKFYNDALPITEAFASHLRQRRERFRNILKTKKALFNTLITTYGVKHNKNSSSQIDHIITMDKLFILNSFDWKNILLCCFKILYGKDVEDSKISAKDLERLIEIATGLKNLF